MTNLNISELSKEPDPSAKDTLKPWLEFTQSKAFLSSEFLLWLWYFIESEQNPTMFQAGSDALPVKLWIEDKIVLESSGAKAHTQTLKGGDPSGSIEAGSGLLSGKTVKELKIGLHIDSFGEFAVLLASKDLSPKAIQLPSTENGPTTLEHRLKVLELLMTLVDHLFVTFLSSRTQDDWVTLIYPKIEQWIETRGHQESHLH